MRYVPCRDASKPDIVLNGFAVLCECCYYNRLAFERRETAVEGTRMCLDMASPLREEMPEAVGSIGCVDCDRVDDHDEEPYDVRDSRDYVYAHRHD